MLFATKRWFLMLICCFFVCISCYSICMAENVFNVIRVGNIITYGVNHFKVNAPEDGNLIITVHDDICTYRVMQWHVEAGESSLTWDGCGFNREKLYYKNYIITCKLEGASGKEYSKSFNSPIAFTDQALQYALPSSKVLYLDKQDEWFIEFRTVMNGTVIIEFNSDNKDKDRVSFSFSTKGGKNNRKKSSDFIENADLIPGCYTVKVYEISKPHDSVSFVLQVEKKAPDKTSVFITGEIMPDRTMSEQEIWQLMMAPSVVVDIDFFDHQEVYEKPEEQSKSLGTLHGQTQCLKIIDIEKSWAFIGAWNHEEAEYVEGWVPLEKLKVEEPQSEYGILIDKQKQTLSLFYQGSIVETLYISTGRSDMKRLYQETSAGSFLTGYHRVNFSTNGKKYDYVIQYDGGNLLHQTPYQWGHNKKDFTLGRGYLGAKASHACIRIQADPGKNGINAYWLWTHIPYHTRVVILDDPVERRGFIQQLNDNPKQQEPLPENLKVYKIEDAVETEVVFTFGGNFIPGTRQSAQQKGNSFLSLLQNKGYDIPFSELETYFSTDDFSCISLCSPLEKTQGFFSRYTELKYAPSQLEEIFTVSSIEGIQITDNYIYEQDENVIKQTEEAAGQKATLICRGKPVAVMIKGHLFGLAACSETEYLKNPDVIDNLISELKERKCERIIILISWGETKSEHHSIVQEAMARRCVNAGADLIIGSHPHRLQGIDRMMDVPVIYSLGDLLDGSTRNTPKKQYGILIRAVFQLNQSSGAPDITVIPLKPYGNNVKMNEYIPTASLNRKESSDLVDMIRKDSPTYSIDQIGFYYHQ